MSVLLQRELASTPHSHPDGSSPIGVRQLVESPATLLSSFPPGWQRESAGHFSEAEEFIVLAGAVAMNDEVHRAGTWVLVPAKSIREATRTPEGALVVAWSDAPARWNTDGSGSAGRCLQVDLGRQSRTAGKTPFGPGRLLRRRRSWWVNELQSGPTNISRQVLSTDPDGIPRLHTLDVGDELPQITGPCFVRTGEDVR